MNTFTVLKDGTVLQGLVSVKKGNIANDDTILLYMDFNTMKWQRFGEVDWQRFIQGTKGEIWIRMDFQEVNINQYNTKKVDVLIQSYRSYEGASAMLRTLYTVVIAGETIVQDSIVINILLHDEIPTWK